MDHTYRICIVHTNLTDRRSSAHHNGINVGEIVQFQFDLIMVPHFDSQHQIKF